MELGGVGVSIELLDFIGSCACVILCAPNLFPYIAYAIVLNLFMLCVLSQVYCACQLLLTLVVKCVCVWFGS